jgi:hypothetical protein
LIRVGKTFWRRLALSHAVPAGSYEVTVAFHFISERIVYGVKQLRILSIILKYA